MTRIILSGCGGRMGRVITMLSQEYPDLEIVSGIDVFTPPGMEYPVFENIADCDVRADVIIDFSSPAAFDALADYAESRQIPVVVCTTGLSEEQLARLEKVSKKTAVLRSANMSLGINLLMKLLREAAPVLAQAGFDIEIVEKHHNKKKDAPSGTAYSLAESINEAMDGKYRFVTDRSQVYEQRGSAEIGISALRGGTIPGEHEVIFAGTDEVITLKHTAYSRAIFAKGALAAAYFLAGKAPGYYDMSDVIEGQ